MNRLQRFSATDPLHDRSRGGYWMVIRGGGYDGWANHIRSPDGASPTHYVVPHMDFRLVRARKGTKR